MIINGVSGRLEFFRWHTGKDFRLTVYNQPGNSIYFASLKPDQAKQFVELLRNGYGQFRNGRAQMDVTKKGDVIEISTYDTLGPANKVKMWLNINQVSEIEAAYNKSLEPTQKAGG